MAASPKKSLALDTNLLLDLAGGKDFAHEFKEEFSRRGYSLLVPPTVVGELTFFSLIESAPQHGLAVTALELADEQRVVMARADADDDREVDALHLPLPVDAAHALGDRLVAAVAVVDAPANTIRIVLGARANSIGAPRQPSWLVTSPIGDVVFGRKRNGGLGLPSSGSKSSREPGALAKNGLLQGSPTSTEFQILKASGDWNGVPAL